jgi:hypothetical protein
MGANQILTQSRKGAEKRRAFIFSLCGTLRLCVSALMFSVLAVYGQGHVAYESYVDGKVHVEPFRPPKPRGVVTNSPAWKKKAAARRAAIEARRNVLPGLKDAQLKAHDAKHSESNVTVNINIGGR